MYLQHQNTQEGDMFIVKSSRIGHRGGNHYSDPTPVTKVTKTQFTLMVDGKALRFKRTDGRQIAFHGSSWRAPEALIATDQLMATIKEEREEIAKEEREQAFAERQNEIALRGKYNALGITDDAIQATFLAPLREMAETSEEKINKVLRYFENVSVEKQNFYRVADDMKRTVESGDMEYGTRLNELALGFHNELVEMLTDFANGAAFEVDGTTITNAVDLAMAATRYELNKMMDRFFGWKFRSEDIAAADQKYISELRGIMKDTYSRVRVRKIEVAS